MSKKILLSTGLGLIGFLFTFLTNYGHNLVGTSLIRGIYGFIIWFVLAFLLRWVLGVIIGKSSESSDLEAGFEDNGEALGAKLDIQTPEEDQELKDLLTPKPEAGSVDLSGFTPLQPPKLVSMKDPEELAKAVRHLKEE
ncbi:MULTISPECIES: hypothetical protein [Paenibacillus]|jgi:hypothetical protein|uniref:hypothetical protein n=1 Tax=Paenibacillus TaxID=44249 RepID=UPI0004F8EBF1|nr:MULTISPECIES: hypothetical protein [unclassified Paenibacillus]AIQ30493.1 hypothetical protein P40081_21760 [Paenibacillus sp. FSL P4-0081]AIQ42054.1 hypothetical protein R50912_19890 [Paenibacillus sp. FSL R5-0912]OMF23636.1 hypothetical protein BK132_26380 [Paenibacillus sp. FSL H8-0259]